MSDNKTGIELIAEERKRQIESEGWTPEHDAQHFDSELAYAAMVYCHPEPSIPFIRKTWPFNEAWYKPSALPYRTDDAETIQGRVRELQKAGALIAAEIDRLQNAKSNE